MKALIFNSGLGSRMGDLTKNNPKCLVKLYNGETILSRQIRILKSVGIKDIVITTGPYKEMVMDEANKFIDINFTFVENNDYMNTNYIMSMYNAIKYLDDDYLLLHGDLVFNKSLVRKVIDNENKSVCLFNEEKDLPEKDFKGRFNDNKLMEVSISIFDDDCFAFQPLYKLDKNTLSKWCLKVEEFILNDNKKVYAENALNEITNDLEIIGLSYKDDYIDEIDNELDYDRVSNDIKYFDYREQEVIECDNYLDVLDNYINEDDKLFVVCGKSLLNRITNDLSKYNFKVFSDFYPNPKYEDIMNGLELFKSDNFNMIMSIGGGSSIDVAKSIKCFYSLKNELDFLDKKYTYNSIVHIAIPTTAGTGSESTQFAVLYYEDKKISIDHGSLLPDVSILDSNFLESLSDYQKKSTMADLFCQAIESFYSINSSIESKEYSKKAITLFLEEYRCVFYNNKEAFKKIMKASNYAGKAINLTRTTAAHAMSYKLSSMYNISHGHSVFLLLVPCLKNLYEYSKNDKDLNNTLLELSSLFDCSDIDSLILKIEDIVDEFNLEKISINDSELEILIDSVNLERLSNHPIKLTNDNIKNIYLNI